MLSAKYGLIAVDRRPEPYEQTLKKMSARNRRQWAERVFSQIWEPYATDLANITFVFHVGVEYREGLVEPTHPLRSHLYVPGGRAAALNQPLFCD